MAKIKTHHVKYLEYDLIVKGYYSRAYFGTYYQPPEPEMFEIEKILLNDEDLTWLFENLISESTKMLAIEEIEQIILEDFYGDYEGN